MFNYICPCKHPTFPLSAHITVLQTSRGKVCSAKLGTGEASAHLCGTTAQFIRQWSSFSNFLYLHVGGRSGVPHTSRGRILQSKILKVALPRLTKWVTTTKYLRILRKQAQINPLSNYKSAWEKQNANHRHTLITPV